MALALIKEANYNSLSIWLDKGYTTIVDAVSVLKTAGVVKVRQQMTGRRPKNIVSLRVNLMPNSEVMNTKLKHWNEYKKEYEKAMRWNKKIEQDFVKKLKDIKKMLND